MSTAQRRRLSLTQQLVLLLVGTALLAVTVLGGFVAWNLRAGFTDYLRAQDEHWLDRFAEVAAAAVAARGLAAIAGPPGSLQPLFDAVAPAAGPQPPPLGGDGPPPGEGRAPPRHLGLPGRPPPGGQRTPDRLSLVNAQGHPLAGRLLLPSEISAQRAIKVSGQVVAWARLVKAPFATQEVDAAFLGRQYSGIIWSAALLLLAAVAGAVWAGGRWLRPVRELQHAARRVAQGAFDVRLAPQSNDELADLAGDINAMAASLQQLEASRRRWLAELSHEMRTPLAILRGEVEALVDGVRPVNAAALQSLQEEVARVTRLMDDFHQLALSDLRALPCMPEPLAPGALLAGAVARVQARATAAGLSLRQDCTDAPAQVHWDRQRIGQLLDNLLHNSLRYTDAPGQIWLRLAPAAPGQLSITLDDSAPGVAAHDLPQLFDPLFRAEASRSRRSGGSGLGLSICRAIVRSHGGGIEAGPSPWGGLRVVVTLPLRAQVPEASGS